MQYQDMFSTKKMNSDNGKVGLFFAIMIVVTIVIGLFWGITGLQASAAYEQVEDRFITVEGIVTKHDAKTSDDTTTYYAYATYTVNGTVYKNVKVDSAGNRSKILPIGTKVQLEVNPEDPVQTKSDLISNARAAVALLLPMAVALAFLCSLWRKRLSRDSCKIPETDVVIQDLMVIISGRFWRKLWLMISLYLLWLHKAYPGPFGRKALVATCVFGVFWGIGALRAVRDSMKARHQAYHIQREGTNQHVYLEGRKKSILYYDRFGNAHRK